MAQETKSYSTQITRIDVLNPSVKLFRFTFQKPFSFLSGQFVMLHLKCLDGKPIQRAYSICSPALGKNFIELCIRKVAGGMATQILFSLKEGDTIEISGPLGKFQLPPVLQKDMILVAGGTGIAPIRSILHTLPLAQLKNKFWFYFGINTLDDFLFQGELQVFEKLKNFKLILVVKEDPRWKGDSGFISEALMQKYTPDVSDKEIYMCGPPAMLRFIKAYLPNLGAKPEQIHIDAWE